MHINRVLKPGQTNRRMQNSMAKSTYCINLPGTIVPFGLKTSTTIFTRAMENPADADVIRILENLEETHGMEMTLRELSNL
ncbi:hypothetical protein PRIPAC_76240 [Pristionchus pacificus]|uniref:Uncharacterized protein n=1 Tax=Pristionchus pacificus TaxID=54126 RepID=A0A2A6CF51_PRIPA|nr:hypothetical protein PRIPAC_76240 [Pristionchus pacificus]|eukprot:PDM76834.1 hypothetical protein PRIPAC_42229 [Pristionchus pacificus]